VAIDTCRVELRNPIPIVPRGTTLYINNDCVRERDFQQMCGYTDDDSLKYRTGVDGKETQIHWIVGTAPPAPNMRIWPCGHEGGPVGVSVFWDNFSESVPDIKTQQFDFEGYRVWRADNWTRPLGSSEENGPGAELWKLLFQTDVINNYGDDSGMERYRYEPLRRLLTAAQKESFVQTIKQYLTEFPDREPLCPQGVIQEVCDTLLALARWDLGLEGGRQYYMYNDTAVHLGRPYFYSVTALDHGYDDNGNLQEGKIGDPSSNFRFVEPRSGPQPAWSYDPGKIYVVPNPATKESLQPWTLDANQNDPTGIKVEFRNLPQSRGMIRVYTLSGDLVVELPFDASITACACVEWDLVSRNKQDVASGVYLYSVESDDANFDRFIGKFVVIR